MLVRVKCLDMLEGLDTYLWSNRNKMIAPSYNHQIEEEFNLRNTHQESDIKVRYKLKPYPHWTFSSAVSLKVTMTGFGIVPPGLIVCGSYIAVVVI